MSYKPQQVDLIPKQFSGKVRDILAKIDVNKQLDKIAEELNLANFLDTDIDKVSGGELQKIAIAATVLKGANLYLFDEPTSYLDIKQRINVAKFISDLADENTAPMVIEHDLVVLDYIADLVNIMYGHENVFGIVSGLKPTRVGINSFLEGFLKEENVRFRDYPIKFNSLRESRGVLPIPLLSWEGIEVKLGNFSLKTDSGTFHKNEIIGILGENGIGKTTFIKILAGIIKPAKSSLNKQIKIT